MPWSQFPHVDKGETYPAVPWTWVRIRYESRLGTQEVEKFSGSDHINILAGPRLVCRQESHS